MDYSNSQSIPFESVDYNHGLKLAKGLLKVSGDGIELEYREQDSFVGVIKSDLRTIHIPYEDLEAIEFEKGWFSAKILLKTSSMALLEKLPGNEQGICTLKVKRRHREEAKNTSSKARIALSEQKLDQLENGDADQ